MSTSIAIPRGDQTSQARRPIMDRASDTVRRVRCAIALLCVFARKMLALSSTELAERLRLAKSAVQCQFPALMGRRLVARTPFRRHSSLVYPVLALARVVPGVPAEAERRSIRQPRVRGRREVATGI